MTDSPGWTGPHVAQLHIGAFRVMPSWPLRSRKFADFDPAGTVEHPAIAPGPHKVFSWAEQFDKDLPPRGRVVLFVWASAKARHHIEADESLRSVADGMGLSWSAFLRIKDRTAQRIARRLNAAKVPIFYL